MERNDFSPPDLLIKRGNYNPSRRERNDLFILAPPPSSFKVGTTSSKGEETHDIPDTLSQMCRFRVISGNKKRHIVSREFFKFPFVSNFSIKPTRRVTGF